MQGLSRDSGGIAVVDTLVTVFDSGVNPLAGNDAAGNLRGQLSPTVGLTFTSGGRELNVTTAQPFEFSLPLSNTTLNGTEMESCKVSSSAPSSLLDPTFCQCPPWFLWH